MNRNGFTLVEIIATIAILSLLSLLIMPNIMKNYNQSKIDAITIQKNKLVEAGDIFLDDYCKDAINSSYKQKCEIYYQSLDSTLSSQLSDEKDYKYICVDDIKKLEYYTEDLKFGGTLCHGVVVYEIDKYTKMQTDSFSYVECGKEYPIEKTEYDIKLRNLFGNCFPDDNNDSLNTEENHIANKKYSLTINFVENYKNGKQIRSSLKPEQEELKRNSNVIYSFNAPKFERNGNTYVPVASVEDSEIIIEKNETINSDGSYTFNVKKLPNRDAVITIVYTVQEFKVKTNYYQFALNAHNNHNNETFISKPNVVDSKFRFEKHNIDMPKVIYEKINNIEEKFNLKYVYLDGNLMADSFDGVLDIDSSDYVVDLVYQRETFNIYFDNTDGSGCSKVRLNYNSKFGDLCTPTRKGYIFKGWSLSKNGKLINNNDINDYYKDLTLYAVWEPIKFDLVFNGNNSSSGSMSKVTCTYDKDCLLPSSSFLRTGHNFKKWYLNSNQSSTGYDAGYNFINFTDKNETINLYAGWNVNTYHIVFNAGIGGSGSMQTISLKYTDVINLPESTFTKSGFKFNNWNGTDGKTYNEKQEVSKLTDVNNGIYTMTVIWKDIVRPTCTLIANASGVSFGSKNDNVGVTSYGLVKSMTVSYNNKSSVSLSSGTFYGYVKDDAGNVNNCSIVISETHATKYDKVTSKCNSNFLSYTKTTKTCNKNVSYSKTTKTCNKNTKYRKTVSTCTATNPTYTGPCYCRSTPYSSPTNVGCDSSSCSGRCSSLGMYYASGGCTGPTYTYSWSSSSSDVTSCSTVTGSCSQSSHVGNSKVSCTDISTYTFGSSSTTTVSSCSSNTFTCNSSNSGSTYVSCVDNTTYTWGGTSTSYTSSCSSNNIGCSSSTAGSTYVSCSANYENFWTEIKESVTSCSTTSSFSCNNGNKGSSYVSKCTPTAFACSDSSQTMINNSYCYKY